MRGNGARGAPRVKHLFTDASCIRQRGIASWAGMLVDGMSSALRSGLIRAALRNGTAAEAHGVRYALRTFIALGMIEPRDTIIVHLDNQGVVEQLANDRAPLPKELQFRTQIERIRRTARHYELAVCAQWIRGHQGLDATDVRSLINQRLDREAKIVSRAENRRRIDLGDAGRVPKAQQIEEDELQAAE